MCHILLNCALRLHHDGEYGVQLPIVVKLDAANGSLIDYFLLSRARHQYQLVHGHGHYLHAIRLDERYIHLSDVYLEFISHVSHLLVLITCCLCRNDQRIVIFELF